MKKFNNTLAGTDCGGRRVTCAQPRYRQGKARPSRRSKGAGRRVEAHSRHGAERMRPDQVRQSKRPMPAAC
jgi:hypothetical protein